MPKRWLGIVVSSTDVTAVDAEVPKNGPLVLQGAHSWPLQTGDRSKAYAVMSQRISDYVGEHGISKVVIKESAVSLGGTKKAHLHAAELRGVVIAAAAAHADVRTISKANISNNFGSRTVDEYVKDGDYWKKNVTGINLRSGSREATILLLAARNA